MSLSTVPVWTPISVRPTLLLSSLLLLQGVLCASHSPGREQAVETQGRECSRLVLSLWGQLCCWWLKLHGCEKAVRQQWRKDRLSSWHCMYCY